MEIKWHDFKSLVTVVYHTFENERAAVEAAAKAAAKPPSNDLGGLQKLKAAHEKALQMDAKCSEAVQSSWAVREEDINERLKTAHDKLASAPDAPAKESAQILVDRLKEEQSNFYMARSQEKTELTQGRQDLKRKYEADFAKQREHNKVKNGTARKQMMEALESATPMDVEPGAGAASSSAATVAISASAKAHDPIYQLAKAVVEAAVSAALAELDGAN